MGLEIHGDWNVLKFLKSLPPYHEPSIESLQQHSYFWQSDNSRFWFYKEDEEFMSFPAVLLTDTGLFIYILNILCLFIICFLTFNMNYE